MSWWGAFHVCGQAFLGFLRVVWVEKGGGGTKIWGQTMALGSSFSKRLRTREGYMCGLMIKQVAAMVGRGGFWWRSNWASEQAWPPLSLPIATRIWTTHNMYELVACSVIHFFQCQTKVQVYNSFYEVKLKSVYEEFLYLHPPHLRI